MKHLTADPVLQKTFAHLEEILDEKNRQMIKAAPHPGETPSKTASVAKTAIKKTATTEGGELCYEIANSDC